MKTLPPEKIPRLMTGPSYRIDVSLRQIRQIVDDYVGQGLDLDPDFQRGHVWNEIQRMRWMEFLIKGGKSYSSILLNHPGWNTLSDGEFVLVDGKQRLTAILDFLDDKFPVFLGLDGRRKGWLASQIDQSWVGRIFISLAVNDLPTRADVLRWYLELNEGAVAHSEDELARVRGLLANVAPLERGSHE